MSRIRIGQCVLDRADGALTSEHGNVRLEPKLLAVLLLLIERQGAVVPHEDLRREVWADTHVVPSALARTISLLRTALGDDAYHPSYIETVPKRGYRLIAEVAEIAEIAPAHDDGFHAGPPPTRVRLTRWLALVATVTLLVMTSVVGNPMHRQARLASVGEHLTRAGNENALARYQQAVVRDPLSSDAYAGLATAYVFRANYLPNRQRWVDEAVAAATRAAALDEENLVAIRAMAMSRLQAGHYPDAERLFRRILAITPGDHDSRTNLGRTLLASGRLAEAAELFEDRLRVEPDTVVGYAHAAGVLAFAGYPREATLAAQAAIAIEPYAHDPQMIVARLELLDGHYAQVRARLERLLEVYPDCTLCTMQIGLSFQLSGDLASAERHYRTAVAAQFPTASLRLAHVLALTNRSSEVPPLLDQAERGAHATLAAGNGHSHAAWLLAAAAGLRGDRASAERWYGVAIDRGRRDALWDLQDPLLAELRGGAGLARVVELFEIEHAAAAASVRRMTPRLTRHVVRGLE